MALVHKDRVADLTNTTGTASFVLLGSSPTGYRTFSAAFNNNDTVRYVAQNSSGSEWEVGEGVWTSGSNTLSRTTIFASSNSNAIVSFSAGSIAVTSCMTARDAASVTSIIDKVYVTKTTAQTTASSATTVVLFNNVVADTNSLMNTSTGRVTPKKPGFYQVNVRVRTDTSGFIAAYVGGVSGGSVIGLNVGSDAQSANAAGGSCVIYCNGTTDYIESGMYCNSARAITTTGETWMQVFGPL